MEKSSQAIIFYLCTLPSKESIINSSHEGRIDKKKRESMDNAKKQKAMGALRWKTWVNEVGKEKNRNEKMQMVVSLVMLVISLL